MQFSNTKNVQKTWREKQHFRDASLNTGKPGVQDKTAVPLHLKDKGCSFKD